jgi:hypothetical protein
MQLLVDIPNSYGPQQLLAAQRWAREQRNLNGPLRWAGSVEAVTLLDAILRATTIPAPVEASPYSIESFA